MHGMRHDQTNACGVSGRCFDVSAAAPALLRLMHDNVDMMSKSNLHCYQFKADDAAEMGILLSADSPRRLQTNTVYTVQVELSKRVWAPDQQVAGMHRTMSGNTLAHPSARASLRFAGRKPRAMHSLR